MIFKICWLIRGFLYKPFFGKYQLPSYIGKPTFISNFKKIYIGSKVRIFPHARIECIGYNSRVIINDNVSIGQNLHLTAGLTLEIGQDTTISANVLITDIQHEYRGINKHVMDQPLIMKQTHIGKNCFIGYGAVIDAGTVLGEHCIVGANAVLKGHFPDYSVIVGVPGRVVKRYNHKTKKWEGAAIG
jgi:acetyltransferase-like isoleucine patch superfamily enzyme